MDWYSEGAIRHLSADQFMNVKSLASMPYVESSGDHPVNQWEKSQRFDRIEHYVPGYVTKAVEAMHRGTIDPVHINHPAAVRENYRQPEYTGQKSLMLGNGGHRVSVANREGVHRLPVTPEKTASYENMARIELNRRNSGRKKLKV